MKTLFYKDFIGTLNYNEENEVLYGKIEGITHFITFEGDSIAAIKNAFHEAVDIYTESCKEQGKEPATCQHAYAFF